MSEFQKIFKGFFWNHLGRLAEYILIYFFTVIIARLLGSATNGLYATFVSITQLLLILASFGLEMAVTSYIPKLDADKGVRAGLLRNLLLTRFAAVLIIGILYLMFRDEISLLLHFPVDLSSYFMIVFLFFGFRSITSLLTIFLLANFETKKISIVNISLRLLEILGAYILIQSKMGLKEILIFITITSSLTVVIYLFLLKDILLYDFRIAKGLQIPYYVIKPFLTFGGMIWVTGMFDFMISRQSNIFMLNYFIGNSAIVGQYDVATNFGQMINFGLTTGMFGVSVASFSSVGKSSPSLLPNYFGFLCRMIVLLVVPAFIFSIWFAARLIPFLYSESYFSSVILFQVFALFLLASRILCGGVTADYIQSVARLKILLFSSLIGGTVNIVLAVILIPKFTAMGAVYAAGFSLLLTTALHGYFAAGILRFSFPVVFSVELIIYTFISIIITGFILAVLGLNNIIICVIVFLIVYFLILVFFKPLKYEDVIFIQYFNPRIKKFVESIAKLPDRVSGLTDRQKWAFAWMPDSKIAIDVGSGVSPLLDVISEKSKVVIAVDNDLPAVQKDLVPGADVKFITASAADLPVRSGSCDTVLLLDVLEHVEDSKKTMDEIYRILKIGGILILSVPHKGLFRFLDPLNLKKGTDNIHRHYSEDDLKNLLGYKFRWVQKHYGGLFLYPITFAANNFFRKHFNLKLDRLFKRLGDLDNDLSWGKFSYNLIIMVEKIV